MKTLINTFLVIFFSIFGLFSYKILYEKDDWISKKPIHTSSKLIPQKTTNKSNPINSVKQNTKLRQQAKIKKSPAPPPTNISKRNYFYRFTLISGGEISGAEVTKKGDIIHINSRSGISTRVKQQAIEKIERIDIKTNTKEEISLISLVKNEQ